MTDNSLDIEKALAMVNGQNMNSFYESQVSNDDQQLVRDALENIFQGISVIEWANGGMLMDAWNRALDSIRDEFFATSCRDVFTMTLQRLVFEHRNKWQDKIHSNDNRLHIMRDTIKSDAIPELVKHAQFQKQQGYEIIKKLIDKYSSGFKTVKPQINQDNRVPNIVREKKLERENEYVRERSK